MHQHFSFCFLILLLSASSCSVKKSIGVVGKLQAMQTEAIEDIKIIPKEDKAGAAVLHSNPRLVAPHLIKKPILKAAVLNFKTTQSIHPKGDGNNPLTGKSKKRNATDDPDPRTTEKLGIIGLAAGVVGVVGLFTTSFLPLIFAAAVIAILGGLVGVMRSKEKYKRQGFAKASLVLGLITLIGLAIML